jgi:hypothetical protein
MTEPETKRGTKGAGRHGGCSWVLLKEGEL